VRLGLLRDGGTSRAELALDRGDRLSGDLADRAPDAAGVGRPAELLDPRRDLALVVARLLEVLLEPLLVRLLLGQRDVRGEVRLELGLLRVRLVEPLDELCVTFVRIWHG
jgi:hypothetical protein